jgi:hypothetical protein
MRERPKYRLPGMRDDRPPFRFSEEGRKRIAQTLPDSVHSEIQQLEDIVRWYLTGYPTDLAGREKKWRRIETRAHDLAQLIREVRVHEDSLEWIGLMLEDLARDAQRRAGEYAMGGKRREKHRLEREGLYNRLADFWVRFVGDLSYANAYDEVQGDTARFFKELLSQIPDIGVLTDDGIVDIIRRNRKRRKAAYPVSGD